MAGVLGIYGLITAIIINGKMAPAAGYSAYLGYAHLAAGLTVGMRAPVIQVLFLGYPFLGCLTHSIS
jgi:hypothetical protein